MKIFISLFIILLFAIACGSPAGNSNKADSVVITNAAPVTDTLCFMHVEGKSNQDTSSARLVITGNTVSGDFLNIPHEKDSRKGTLNGTRQGNMIRAVWSYLQEGMWDTLSVEFKLEGDRLMQKNFSVNKETGRQFLSDTSRFTIEYNKIDCGLFPNQK